MVVQMSSGSPPDLDPWERPSHLRGLFAPVTWRRDDRLDILRGWCVAVLIVDHVAGWSPLYVFTGGAAFYVSAAEGFVCLAGYLVGAVLRRLLERRGLRAVWQKAALRGAMLYSLMVAMTGIVAALGMLAHVPFWNPAGPASGYPAFLGRVATFQYWMHHTRILGMYSLLIVVAPLGIALMRLGATRALLACSWLLYAVYEFSPQRFSWPFPVDAYFHPYAYQVLFVHLMALGYHRDAAARLMTRDRRERLFWVGVMGFSLLIGHFLWFHFGTPPKSVGWTLRLFGRDFLRPGRLVATLCAGVVSYLGLSRAPARFYRAANLGIGVLGRRALFCYALHLPMLVLVDWSLPRWPQGRFVTPALNLAAQLLAVGFVWCIAELRNRLLPRAAYSTS